MMPLVKCEGEPQAVVRLFCWQAGELLQIGVPKNCCIPGFFLFSSFCASLVHLFCIHLGAILGLDQAIPNRHRGSLPHERMI